MEVTVSCIVLYFIHSISELFDEGSRKRSSVKNERDLMEDDQKPEALNAKALAVINRVNNKLTGRDFKTALPLDVPDQVDRLILQATSLENLCQCYIGWCAFW